MPLYEYRCTAATCAHTFEDFAGYDAPLPPCPKCAAPTVKVIHAPKGPMFMRFAGSESTSTRYGFSPDRVDAARREFPEFQHCINERGDVSFSDLNESRRFADAFESKYPHPEVTRAEERKKMRAATAGNRAKREKMRAELRKATKLKLAK